LFKEAMMKLPPLILLAASLCCATARAAEPAEPVLETDFSKMEPFSTGYSAGGGPEKSAALGAWGTNLWKAGSQAESGVAEEPRTKMRAFYMTNREGTPSIQLFTLKPLELKPGRNYLASFVYMTDDEASGSFSVRPQGEGEPTREELAGIGIWKERVVPFSAPPSGQVSFLFQTGAVNARLWLREFRLREGPRQWKPSPAELPAPGARLDEARAKRVLRVSPSHKAARDSNVGTAQSPLKSFGGALEAAAKYLRAGQGVKILLAPGFYREGALHFDGEKGRRPSRGRASDYRGRARRASRLLGSGRERLGGRDVDSGGRPEAHLQARLAAQLGPKRRELLQARQDPGPEARDSAAKRAALEAGDGGEHRLQARWLGAARGRRGDARQGQLEQRGLPRPWRPETRRVRCARVGAQ
jgi:hypothetical protein